MLRWGKHSRRDSGASVLGVPRARKPKSRPRLRIRHVFEEASFHLSATWAELADWIRIGR